MIKRLLERLFDWLFGCAPPSAPVHPPIRMEPEKEEPKVRPEPADEIPELEVEVIGKVEPPVPLPPAEMAPPPEPEEPEELEAPDYYWIKNVKWDEPSVGLYPRGKRRLWVYGTIQGEHAKNFRSPRVYLAPKNYGSEYHLVFLPKVAVKGLSVRYSSGWWLGKSHVVDAPGSEWDLEDDLVKQTRATLDGEHEWVKLLADDLGVSVEDY